VQVNVFLDQYRKQYVPWVLALNEANEAALEREKVQYNSLLSKHMITSLTLAITLEQGHDLQASLLLSHITHDHTEFALVGPQAIFQDVEWKRSPYRGAERRAG
jgi:hypothetical protein